MTEDMAEKNTLSRWAEHRFLLLVAGTIVVSLFLVGVALALYASSGTAQLDLSRPGYKSVRDQAVKSDTFDGFPTSGPIDKGSIDQFRTLYQKEAGQLDESSFGGSVMSDQALSIDDSSSVK